MPGSNVCPPKIHQHLLLIMKSTLLIIAGAAFATAQVPAWGQCGGSGYSGATTCVSGYACVAVNQWYSQCQAGGSAPAPAPASTLVTSVVAASTPPAGSAPTSGTVGLRYLGRVNPATKELTWPGTGVSFTFTGSSATIHVSSVTGTNSADLIIDGGAPIDISSVTGDISTPAGLASGTHTVQLRKRSEAIFGSIFISGVTTDGTLGVDKAPTRQIEVIGDSITVGYGLDGTNPCTNNAAVEDNPKTYAALAANGLGADYNVIAWSGKGVIRNLGETTQTSPLVPELWTRYGANDADNSYTFPSSWMPQAVVINLGTNDFSYLGTRSPIDPKAYQAGIVNFVKTIQTHYPKAQFFLLSSPMLSDYYPTTADAQHTTEVNALKAAVGQIGPNAHFVDWPTQGSDVACDYHPNAATQAAEGKVLEAAISSVLGW